MRFREKAAPAVYQVQTQRNVYAEMRDGVRLATDLHRPSHDGNPLDGPFPVLLQRTPYNKSTEIRDVEADFFAARGYVVAIQDCRGRHASEGGFTKYTSDGPDGYDTVEWLAQQSWCDGKIGTFGLSYAAHTQAALACLNPPHLACMWLECGGFSDAFLSGCRNGGVGNPLDGPFPVLLQCTPYNKSTEIRDVEADFFAARGYVVAIQDPDLRGLVVELPDPAFPRELPVHRIRRSKDEVLLCGLGKRPRRPCIKSKPSATCMRKCGTASGWPRICTVHLTTEIL